MQFLPATFAATIRRHPPPPGGASPPSPYNPSDAIYTAVAYLCDNGAATDLPTAIFRYNNSDDYVDDVLAQAIRYSQPSGTIPGGNTTHSCGEFTATGQWATISPQAQTAITFACAQNGKPYVWGGTGNPGFDCSGLTQIAYGVARVHLPRTAQEQYDADPPANPGAGGLAFFGTPGNVTHVGLILGEQAGHEYMIDAPHQGATVRVEAFPTTIGAAWGTEVYLGATQPAPTPPDPAGPRRPARARYTDQPAGALPWGNPVRAVGSPESSTIEWHKNSIMMAGAGTRTPGSHPPWLA